MLSGYTTSSDSLGPPSQGRAGGVAPEAAAGQEKARGEMRRLIPVAIVLPIVAGRRCGSLVLVAAAPECSAPRHRAGQRTSAIDYQAVIAYKRWILETPWSNFHAGACGDLRPAYGQFCNTRRHWLEDYALFRARKASQIRRQLRG
jgi:hypothetical protein